MKSLQNSLSVHWGLIFKNFKMDVRVSQLSIPTPGLIPEVTLVLIWIRKLNFIYRALRQSPLTCGTYGWDMTSYCNHQDERNDGALDNFSSCGCPFSQLLDNYFCPVCGCYQIITCFLQVAPKYPCSRVGLVGWGHRILRLHHCRGVRLPQQVSWIWH